MMQMSRAIFFVMGKRCFKVNGTETERDVGESKLELFSRLAEHSVVEIDHRLRWLGVWELFNVTDIYAEDWEHLRTSQIAKCLLPVYVFHQSTVSHFILYREMVITSILSSISFFFLKHMVLFYLSFLCFLMEDKEVFIYLQEVNNL